MIFRSWVSNLRLQTETGLSRSFILFSPKKRVGWVERSDSHHRATGISDGFRQGGTHPAGLTFSMRSGGTVPLTVFGADRRFGDLPLAMREADFIAVPRRSIFGTLEVYHDYGRAGPSPPAKRFCFTPDPGVLELRKKNPPRPRMGLAGEVGRSPE